MKKLQLIPYRERDNRFKLKKYYLVKVKKAKNGDLIIPIPDDIVKAYHIEIGDVAIFEIVDMSEMQSISEHVKNHLIKGGDYKSISPFRKGVFNENSFIVRFVKKTMCSFVRKGI